LAPVGGPSGPVTFGVAQGESVSSVAKRLETAGLLRDGTSFVLLARLRGLDRGIQAGRHELRPDMEAEEILGALQVARTPGVRVLVPEGRRAEELASILAAADVASAAEFRALAAEPLSGREARYGAIAARPGGQGLEGYLFPDTYEFEVDAGAEAVLDTLLTTFVSRFDAAMLERARQLDMSPHSVVTLASIVEREARLDSERPRIARVFLNRLAAAPRLLDADPTVQYALGFDANGDTWWKRPLTTDDLAVDSQYNTYRVAGLPPGPIASPGLDSLRAVLWAEEGPWMFFVANEVTCDGSHVFATTFEEHRRNIGRYQHGGC